MATPKTLETMIEYTLISIILDRICKMIKKTIAISKRSHLPKPPQGVVKN
jgi:hypothetical protein